MGKKIQEDTWVYCPECEAKLKQQNLTSHIKHVHNKKINETDTETVKTSSKNKENKASKILSKKTSSVIIMIFIVAVVLISIYSFYYSGVNNQSKDSDNKNNYLVSIEGKGDYSSIQDAVDAASDNDTIYVSKGFYFENIEITKSIKLIGENKNNTIINGNGSKDIVFISADYVNISGFTITNGSRTSSGIKISSDYNRISDCNISSNKNYGIYLDSTPTANNNIINSNTFFYNDYGIYSENAKENNISSNIFTNTTLYAIYLSTSSNDNIIFDNIITDNSYAIRIKGSILNKIIKNQVINNKNGIYFCCGAENNIVYNNILRNNTNWNANDALGNIWDNGKVGNYWDDYNGTDANGDGIGDTPYLNNITRGDGDRYPIMKVISKN